jgi:hypothetical protein
VRRLTRGLIRSHSASFQLQRRYNTPFIAATSAERLSSVFGIGPEKFLYWSSGKLAQRKEKMDQREDWSKNLRAASG